jgi:hypothetical protein
MSNDDIPRSHAEELDDTKIGQSVGQSDQSGDVFPPDQPLAVADPTIRADGSIAPDDVASREERRRSEADADADEVRPDDLLGHDLLDPSDDADRLDDEATAVASFGEDADSAAEVAAVHVVADDR